VGKILSVENLHVQFRTYAGIVEAVRGVSFELETGEVLAIVGESGCGKSVTAQSIMRLIPEPPGKITAGSIVFKGDEILSLSERKMRSIRGNTISMVFQDPMTSLNPVLNVRTQINECLRQHQAMSRAGGRSPGHRTVKPGRDTGSGGATEAIPSRVERWVTAKGDDRYGPGLQPVAVDRRRTNYSA
jgi:dipeptide transport system ATP-binding protein